MNAYAKEDTPLDIPLWGHCKTVGEAIYVCIHKDCDGEHHVYVRANAR